MGFAIGSSSAAISQLILRDLLGIRLMVSPYVPIIAVTIWLIVKQSPKLGVKITHTDTTTLLWLLFPAPLAMTQYSYPTFIFFVIPLFIFAVSIRYKNLEISWLSKNALPFICLLSSILGFFINFNSDSGNGISRVVNNDLRYDVAYALGTAKWGVNSNIAMFGQTESYYKLSYLWLGPIFSNIDVRALDLIESCVPFILVSFLGLAVWTLSQIINVNSVTAGISTTIIYVQTILPESLQLSLRPTWLLGLHFLVTAASLMHLFKYSSQLALRLAIILSGFLVAVTRLSFIFPLFALVIGSMNHKISIWSYLKAMMISLFLLTISIIVGFSLFSFSTNALDNRNAMIQLSEWPIAVSASIQNALINILCIALPFCAAIFIEKEFSRHRFMLVLLISVFFVTSAWVPHLYPADQDFLVPFLVLTAPYVALVVWHAYDGSISLCRSKIFFGFQIFFAGLVLRLLYDFFKLNKVWQTNVESLLSRFVNSGYIFAITPLAISIITVLIGSKRLLNLGNFRLVHLFTIAIFTVNLGVFTGTSLNPVSDAVFNGESIFSASKQPIVERWQDEKILVPLSNLKKISQVNDVVASNFGQGKDARFDEDFRLQLALNRQMYLAGPQYQLLDRYEKKMISETRSPTSTNVIDFLDRIRTRYLTSIEFPNRPNDEFLQNMLDQNVKWFVVDLERTELRDWEPWATTRFINEKVAVLELATNIEG
jgi:hypothetical protein